MIDGNYLKDTLGLKPNKYFGKILDMVNSSETTMSDDDIIKLYESYADVEYTRRDAPAPLRINLVPENDFEAEHLTKMTGIMNNLLSSPFALEGVLQPDACMTGEKSIPVGGVIALKDGISPQHHSADICCSVYVTVLDGVEPKEALDAAFEHGHFGPSGRARDKEYKLDVDLRERMMANPFLNDGRIRSKLTSHLGTSGDGNHFVYLGRLESTGQTVMVTHHGSRAVGALLYKQGKKVADKFRKTHMPSMGDEMAIIPFNTPDGKDYWDALQLVREWTKENHRVMHDKVVEVTGAKVGDRFWNEHNFVFREDMGDHSVFWHAKGATPIHNAFLPDTNGIQIIPMNMAHPILLVKGERNEMNRGFAPHGAGRHVSRSAHLRQLTEKGITPEQAFDMETQGIDARFFMGNVDASELPSAYKSPEAVERGIRENNLANIVDRVLPYGSIMAGDWQKDVDWKKFKKNKK